MSDDEPVIDAGYVPRPRADVMGVELDGETVLTLPFEDDDELATHMLDPTATTVWNCLDGETTLGALAEELAEVYDAEAETILADLVPMIRGLLEAGLLES